MIFRHSWTWKERVAIAFFTFLCLSCLSENSGSTLDIFPLSVGNTWKFVDSTLYGSDSVHVDSSQLTITGTKTVKIEGKDQTVYIGSWTYGASTAPSPLKAYYCSENHSLYNCGAEQDTAHIAEKIIHLQYPTQRGAVYPTHFYNFASVNGVERFDLDTIQVQVLNADTTWSGPAGTFSALVYQGSRISDGWSAKTYYAPGIGSLGYLIKSTRDNKGMPQIVVSKRVLKSYSLHAD